MNSDYRPELTIEQVLYRQIDKTRCADKLADDVFQAALELFQAEDSGRNTHHLKQKLEFVKMLWVDCDKRNI